MMIPWLAYAVVVGALISVAAWLAERGVLVQRWPVRWVWAGALVASVAAPVLAWLLPGPPAAATPLVGAPGAYMLESLPVLSAGSVAPAGPSLDAMILGGWVTVSALLLLAVLGLAVRLGLRLRRWPSRVVDGVEVRVSPDTGPAAMGVVRGRVVVPEWVLALEPKQRRLLVQHESEHVRALDPQLALAGLIVCLLAPWNLPLWWQLQRLRLGIEMDCDARVLRSCPYPRAYGSLLVTVGRRKARLALALAESRSMLERRIRMITNMRTTRAPLRTVALAGASALVLAVACETPGPTGPAGVEQRPLEIDDTRAAVAAMECEPAIYLNATPATLDGVDPDNVETIHVFKGPATAGVREDGEACGVIVVLTKDASAGEADAARRIVERLSAERRERAGAEDTAEGRTLEEVQDAPTFTPMTVAPRLTNQAEVREALQRLYPPLLRDAGIGGTVNVWFLIDREGAVRRTVINEPADHDALNSAALAVAERMAFTPAYNRETRVPVWVALDITFESDAGGGDPAPVGEARRTDDSAEAVARAEQAERAAQAARTAREQRIAAARAPADARDGDVAARPTFTPMTTPPRLVQPQEMARLLQRHYPPLLRDAGIGGTANIWFFIDETGRVARLQINKSSGHDALDEAALAVASQMDFEPARNGDEPVAVWVALDVMFEVQ